MQLDENQKKTVTGWIEEGLDLSAIQSRLESEMDIPMTYMDVRFLVGDLELVPKDEEEPEKEPEEEPKPEEELAPVDGPTPDNPFPAPEDPMGEAPLPTDDVAGGGEVGKRTCQQSYHGFRQYFVQPLSDIVVFIVVGHRVPRLPKAGKD